MEGEPTQQQNADPDELEFGFHPSDPSIIIPQIQLLSLANRTIGFEALVNVASGQMNEDIQKLLDEGLFPLVISSMNESNLKIIGLVCTATRHLIAVAPEYFHELIETMPIDFLLSIPDVPEVIDFLQEIAYNFEDFGYFLLNGEVGQALLNSVGVWLSNNEDTAKSALELINTLAQLPDTGDFDFSFIKPFTDGQYSTDIRALAINILRQIDPENTEHYFEIFLEMFMTEKPTSTVFQIIHDDLRNEEIFQHFYSELLPQIYERSIQNIDVPDSAVVLADISTQLDQESREIIISHIFAQPELCIERADALFRICSENEIPLPPEYVDQLVSDMETNMSEDVLQCTEAILRMNANLFASEDLQMKLLPVFDREPQFSVYAFKLILFCCSECEVVQPVLEAFHDFATQNEANFDEEIHDDVSKFLESHQL